MEEELLPPPPPKKGAVNSGEELPLPPKKKTGDTSSIGSETSQSNLGSTESPSPSVVPSTSKIKANNVRAIDLDKSDVLKQRIEQDFSKPRSEAYKNSYINTLVNKGYDKKQLEDFTKYLGLSDEEKVKAVTESVIGKPWGPLQPISDWATDFGEKTVENIKEGLIKTGKGAVELARAAEDDKGPISTLFKALGETEKPEAVRGALRTVTGGAQVAFNTIPQAVAFNLGMDAINTAAKKNLSEENAKTVETVTSLPFSIVSKTANALGFNPEEGSNAQMLLELGDFVAAAGAFHTGEKISENIKSVKDLKEISEKAAENKLTPEQQIEFNNYAQNLKLVNLEDIKEQAEKSDTPEAKEIVSKINEVVEKNKPENDEVHNKLSELQQKVADESFKELPEEVQQGILNDVEATKAELLEKEKLNLDTQLKEASDNAVLSEIDDKINQAKSSLEGQSEAVANSINKTISELENQKKQIEDAIQKQSNGSVLQYPQEGVGETGSGRGSLESGVQGAEAPKEGQKTAKEEISDPKAKFIEDNIQQLKDEAEYYEPFHEGYVEILSKKYDILNENRPKEDNIEREPIVKTFESEAENADSFTEEELQQKISEIDTALESDVPKDTGISEAMREQQRAELGLEDLPPLDKNLSEHKLEYLNKEANRLVESKEIDPIRLADNVIEGKETTDDLGKAVLLRGATEVGNKIRSSRVELENAKVKGNKESQVKAEEAYFEAIANLDKIHTALSLEGTAAGRNLAAMKQSMKEDYSLGGLYKRFKEANKDQPLPKEIVERLDTYAIKLEELNFKIKEQEELLKKQGVDIENLQKLKPTTKERIKEVREKRNKLFEEWKQSREGGQEKVVKQGLPISDKDIQFAGKIALSYLEEGYLTTRQVSDKLKRDVKDFLGIKLTDQEIYEILDTEVDGKKVIDQFKNDGITSSKSSLSDLVKKAQKGLEKIGEEKEPKERMSEQEKIKRTALTRGSQKALNDLRLELGKTKRKIDNEHRALEFVNKTQGEKFKEGFMNVMGVPRSLMSSFDFSAPLRQGLVASAAHPIIAAKTFPEMFKQAFSKKAAEEWMIEYKNSPDYKLAKDSKLYIADKGELSNREEAFMSNLAEKIPLIGKGIEASERGYTGYLNKLRADVFKQGADALMEQGKSFEKNPEEFKAWADFVNNSTGRGEFSIEAIEKASPLLNTMFFSPKLIKSRLNLLNPAYYAKMPKSVRIMALKDMGKFAAVAGTIVSLFKLNGANVETDPRSSDFLKIKDGDTRYDIFGGFLQYLVLASRLATLKEKTTTKRPKLNSINPYDKKAKKTPIDVTAKFFRNKLSPATGLILDIGTGKTTTGEKTELGKELYSHFAPLQLQDALQSYDKGGMKQVLKTTIPSMFGVGVQTYSSEKNLQTIKKNLEEELKKYE